MDFERTVVYMGGPVGAHEECVMIDICHSSVNMCEQRNVLLSPVSIINV
jgi:hypothetical protein